MPVLEWCLLGLLAAGLALAAWSLSGRRAKRRFLLVVTLLVLIGSALVAAAHRAEMLVYLGLTAGGFVVAALGKEDAALS